MHCKLLATYRQKWNNLVNEEVRELLISHGELHKPVSSELVRKCIKNELMSAGVDTKIFRPHSCLSTSVRKAKVNFILRT